MHFNLAELWAGMGTPVKVVVIVLTLQALSCIAVAIDRVILLTLAQVRARKFVAAINAPMKAGDKNAILALTKEARGVHLAEYLEVGVKVFADRRAGGHDEARAAEFAGRALERKAEILSASLNKGMNVLASTGSTAPFIGLLGTVLGILNAFKLIAQQGSGGMSTIGTAIGEALIVTGYGLTIAIPSVLIYNFISARIAQYETGLSNAGKELVDQLEAGVIVLVDKAPAKPAATVSAEPVAA